MNLCFLGPVEIQAGRRLSCRRKVIPIRFFMPLSHKLKVTATLFFMTMGMGSSAQSTGAGRVEQTGYLIDESVAHDSIFCKGPLWVLDRENLEDAFTGHAQFMAYMEKFGEVMKRINDSTPNGITPIKTNYKMASVIFTEFVPTAAMGFLGVVSYSKGASTEEMRHMFKELGMNLVPAAPKRAGEASHWELETVRLSGENATVFRIVPGYVLDVDKNPNRKPSPGGYSMACHVREATSSEEAAQGLIGASTVMDALQQRVPPSTAWVNEVIARGTAKAKVHLAKHQSLSPAQVQHLLELRHEKVTHSLILNSSVVFSDAQLDFLSHSQQTSMANLLIQRYGNRLSEVQRQHLFQQGEQHEINKRSRYRTP